MTRSEGRTLYVIQWKTDHEIEVTTGYQIEAIRHSEKKWCGGEKIAEVLRRATNEDIKKYLYNQRRKS